MPLPYSQACENNKDPILERLQELFVDTYSVLEIGSGSGQHAEHFAENLTHLNWQPSERAEHLSGLNRRIAQASLPNLAPAIELDINRQHLPRQTYDAIFTANTMHIMSWPTVERMFASLDKVLAEGGRLCIYGPFNYAGVYTSASNELFDQSLKGRHASMGIRDIEQVQRLAQRHGFNCLQDFQMPANNRLLHFYSG
ncbi:MAG: DUF938 domain-containing protein [Idiomarina sp.]|nr:DUF938 domain-containing protein [Idiomarina sp.]